MSAEHLSSSAVLVQGSLVPVVRRLVLRGVRSTERQDGISAGPEVRQLLEVLDTAAREYLREVRQAMDELDAGRVDDQALEPVDEWCSTADAAELLGLSRRQVTRRAAELGGVLRGGAYVFERSAVEVAAHRRLTSGSRHPDVRR